MATFEAQGGHQYSIIHYVLKRTFTECAVNLVFLSLPYEVILAAKDAPAKDCVFMCAPSIAKLCWSCLC